MVTYNFLIPDMMCEHCKKRITETVEAAGGKIGSLDLESKRLTVTTDLSASELVALIDKAGYTAQVIN